MKRGMVVALWLGLSVLGAGAAAGQAATGEEEDTTASPERERGKEEPVMGCWRGRPLPDCGGFFVVEAQGIFPLASTSRSIRGFGGSTYVLRAFEAELDWNLGFMANVDERWAVGGVFTLGTGSSDPVTGLKARVRRWLRSDLSAELQAGALRTDVNGLHAPSPVWGVTADARLNVGDHGSFFLRWDAVDVPAERGPGETFDPGGFHQALSVGAAAGSTWAVAGTAAGFIVLLTLLSQAEFS